MNENCYSICLKTIISRGEDIPTVDLGGEIGMMSIEKGKYYGLDSIGTHIWEIIENPKSVEDIISVLIKEYDVEEETCQEHIVQFLNNLYCEGLVRINAA